MTKEDWKKMNELFHAALVLSGGRREKFLRENCADENLRDEVRALLMAHEKNRDFLRESAFAASLEFIAAPQDFAGRRVGAYEIVGEIGRGGMGAVFLGVRADGAFEGRAAIKLLSGSAFSTHLEKRFRTERQILANLNHPFIARLFDGGTTADGVPYLVMEFIQGNSIVEFARRRNLNVNERLKLFLKVCEAVRYAHSQGIVHRDLKPSNILIADDGTPKLLDFGIAKFLSGAATSETTAGFGFLTPEYASPEQISGLPVTIQSDVYSLGIILYELLTGTRPYSFENRSPLEITRVICESEPTPPSRIIAECGLQNAESKITRQAVDAKQTQSDKQKINPHSAFRIRRIWILSF
jgi:serine/threonine protein kinase